MRRLAVIEAIESILNDRWDKEGPASEEGREHIFKQLEVIQEFITDNKTQMVVNCENCIWAEESTEMGQKVLVCNQITIDDTPLDHEAIVTGDNGCGCCSSRNTRTLVGPSFGCVMGEEEEDDILPGLPDDNDSIPQWVINRKRS